MSNINITFFYDICSLTAVIKFLLLKKLLHFFRFRRIMYIQRYTPCLIFFSLVFLRYNINCICYLSGVSKFRTCLLKLGGGLASTNVTPQIPVRSISGSGLPGITTIDRPYWFESNGA